MTKNLLSIFKKIGVNEKAAKLYFISLSSGADTVQNLAKRAETKRATAYVALAELMKIGLMSAFVKGKKSFFAATPPEQLFEIVKNKELQLARERKEVELIIPELRAIYQKPEGKIAVKYYEGKAGVMRMANDFLHEASGNTIQMIYPMERLAALFTREELGALVEKRQKKKVKTEVVYTFDSGELEDTPGSNRIKIDGKKYPINADIAIFKDKVRLASLGKHLSGVVIEDAAITETLRSLFQLAFGQLKKK